MTQREDEPQWLPVRKGRPPATRGPVTLTPAEEDELAAAKANKRVHVGPGVTAYMLGISKDTLKKRRQRGVGMVPDHVPAKSNRDGVAYVWASVVRCAGAERFSQDVLLQQIEALKQRADDQDAVMEALRAALKDQGLAGLEQALPWAVREDQRIQGLALLHPELPAIPRTLMAALECPWVNEAARQPYQKIAWDILGSAQLRVDDSNQASEPRGRG